MVYVVNKYRFLSIFIVRAREIYFGLCAPHLHTSENTSNITQQTSQKSSNQTTTSTSHKTASLTSASSASSKGPTGTPTKSTSSHSSFSSAQAACLCSSAPPPTANDSPSNYADCSAECPSHPYACSSSSACLFYQLTRTLDARDKLRILDRLCTWRLQCADLDKPASATVTTTDNEAHKQQMSLHGKGLEYVMWLLSF